jgi:twitching motility protein PilJ
MAVVEIIKKLLQAKPQASGLPVGMDRREAPMGQLFGDSVRNLDDSTMDPPAPVEVDPVDDGLLRLPLLGSRTLAQHQRILSVGLALSLLVLVAFFFLARFLSDEVALQMAATGDSLMQSQRLAKSVSQSLMGNARAFPDVVDSANILAREVHTLKYGDARMSALGAQAELERMLPLIDRAEKNAATVAQQQKTLVQVAQGLRALSSQSSELLDSAQAVAALKLQQNASAAEVSAAGQLTLLSQRMGKLASDLLTLDGAGPEWVPQLGKDVNAFKDIAHGLLDGSAELRLSGARDAASRERLEALLKQYEPTRLQALDILDKLPGWLSWRAAQTALLSDSEPLRAQLQALQARLASQSVLAASTAWVMLACAALALLCAGGLARVQLQDSRKRQVAAEQLRLKAEQQEESTKRVNAANQAAILRLMNELQTVAEGDLTQEATVTEDITGAIADSVNYTVEELRSLVGNVQNTATRVAQTTAQVDSTSTELLAASAEQLREIRETGRSVLDMATRINEVSTQAQESAAVARQSLLAADTGWQAVQNTMGGMNAIRDQIQETSKRIKRLGESSQEIGEITELISDITEQTNVLALNAAIQAASAGEAGRGFSVVAEEVQRLAERSADATRQIAALVKAIQTDTQDAAAAMERSTQGVVEGARLSDNAGAALSEIERVSRRLSELIEQISNSASREAELANVVAENIQHIFAVTEQTGEGTRSTAQQVRELSRMADELRQSVSRFKIA